MEDEDEFFRLMQDIIKQQKRIADALENIEKNVRRI